MHKCIYIYICMYIHTRCFPLFFYLVWKRRSEEVRADVWERNRKGNRSNVSLSVLHPPASSVAKVHRDVPRVLLPLFLSSPEGGDRFFLLAVIFHHGQERHSPLKRLNPFGGLGRETRTWVAKGWTKGDSYPRSRIAIFRPLPLYFTPLIPTP